jgi:OmpA-OmpF porin, OOP family
MALFHAPITGRLLRRALVGCVLVGMNGLRAVGLRAQDVDGSKDHPLLSRYPGSVIHDYTQKDFDEFTLPLAKAGSDGKLGNSQHLEGKVTYIHYISPAGRSELEVFRNYTGALQQAGFQTLFTCAREEQCGAGRITLYGSGDYDEYWGNNTRYISTKLARSQGDAYVSVFVEPGHATTDGPSVELYVIETKPMESGLVTVNAASLANDISRTGHVAVYGIYFDTGKSDVKPESDSALQQIAKLLQDNASLKLHVVGHTDNVGTLAANMDLSKRRADAVTRVLTTKYAIAATRLDAEGVGPLAPVASNKDEDGRSKNRRVELVEQ